jgi:sulfate adenylyltransferase subunit 1 (EFTu-like GTPase family)
MFILYFAWKHILHPIKSKNGVNVPSTNTQFIHRPLSWFTGAEYFDKIQKIRNNNKFLRSEIVKPIMLFKQYNKQFRFTMGLLLDVAQ